MGTLDDRDTNGLLVSSLSDTVGELDHGSSPPTRPWFDSLSAHTHVDHSRFGQEDGHDMERLAGIALPSAIDQCHAERSLSKVAGDGQRLGLHGAVLVLDIVVHVWVVAGPTVGLDESGLSCWSSLRCITCLILGLLYGANCTDLVRP